MVNQPLWGYIKSTPSGGGFFNFCRIMQGLVLGPIEGLTAVIMVQAFPLHQRGMAIGLRSIGRSVGQIVSFTPGGCGFSSPGQCRISSTDGA
jgi:MFS family permease